MIKIIYGDAESIHLDKVDMIFTDPPFEMTGKQIAAILDNFSYDHLVLICSMHQAIEFAKHTGLEFGFDLVISHVSPKKSKFLLCAQYGTQQYSIFPKKKC
ncbi:restriction endonuclease subunit M [Actinobacillus pleuropneumoniae]|uniref:restriction endonuclease subunit M n=1 Tax=Actinobacillus pleuropneumoniae TaxID=715 RepID=UPI0000397D6C|nr:restriction endonuclease subunit M [Actinobacillus pleuropneumoniae]